MKAIRKKIIILVSASLTLFVLILILIILPLRNGVIDKSKKIYDNRVSLELVNRQKLDTAATQKDYDRIVKDLEELDKAFIKGKEALQFIAALEKVADSAGVTQEINLSEKKEAIDSIQTSPIELSITGDYRQILKYLSGAEALDYYLNFNLINLSPLKDETILKISGTTYWK